MQRDGRVADREIAMFEAKRVGGLLFARVGSFGGSVYVTRREHWVNYPVAFGMGCVIGFVGYSVLRTVGLL
jgi:hypothetical protein